VLFVWERQNGALKFKVGQEILADIGRRMILPPHTAKCLAISGLGKCGVPIAFNMSKLFLRFYPRPRH
jgi:hypothetical protein